MRKHLLLLFVLITVCINMTAQIEEREDSLYFFLANDKVIDTSRLVTFRNSFCVELDKEVIPITIFIKMSGEIFTTCGYQNYRYASGPELYITTDNYGVYIKNNEIIKGNGNIYMENYIDCSKYDTIACFFNNCNKENIDAHTYKLYEFSYILNSFGEQPLYNSRDSISIRLIEPYYPVSSIFGISGVEKFNLVRINYDGSEVAVTVKRGNTLSYDELYTLNTENNFIKRKSKFRHVFNYIDWLSFNHSSLTYNPKEVYNYHNIYPSLIEFKVGDSYYYYFIRNMQDLKEWSRKEAIGMDYILSKLRKELKKLN